MTSGIEINFAIGIPTIFRADLLNQALEKYAHYLPDAYIHILDNGNQSINQYSENISIHRAHQNLGVAGSWNYLCNNIFQNYDFALILNDDIELCIPQDVISFYVSNKNFDLARCEPEFDMSAFILTKQCFETIKFDEKFFPAYFEDMDYLYQLKKSEKVVLESSLLNPTLFRRCQSTWQNNTGQETSLGKGGRRSKVFQSLEAYYVKKWGGTPGNETYQHSFNQA